MERQTLCDRLAEHYAARTDVAAVYLFGSVARGEARAGSDVDVGVLYREAPPRTLLALPVDDEAALRRRLGRPVEIVAMNHAPLDLVHRVLRDGVLVCEGDRSVRVAYEVRARGLYHDLLPVLRAYRERAGT